jgi:hypothetical protein
VQVCTIEGDRSRSAAGEWMKRLRCELYIHTVFKTAGATMHKADLRQLYQPRPDRLPRWLRRVWAWL